MPEIGKTTTFQRLTQKQIEELRKVFERISEIKEIYVVFGSGQVYVQYPIPVDGQADELGVEWIEPD